MSNYYKFSLEGSLNYVRCNRCKLLIYRGYVRVKKTQEKEYYCNSCKSFIENEEIYIH